MDIQQESFTFKAVVDNMHKALTLLLWIATAIKVEPTGFTCQLISAKDEKKQKGLTACLFFLQSYSVLDSWPENQYVHLTITSCKPFSRELIEGILQSYAVTN